MNINSKSIKEIHAEYMQEKYFKEFQIIDGLNQHPKGLTYIQWLIIKKDTS